MTTGLMPTYLLSLLLMIAVGLFGLLPHDAMAGEPQKSSAPCHKEQTVMGGHADVMEHCGTPDHAMSGACAIACLGSIATWFSSAAPSQVAFRPFVHRASVSLVLRGRTGETDDRPPKFI
jgi:hypothetical protein